jgi:xylan 1,4-beta-xylosidase
MMQRLCLGLLSLAAVAGLAPARAAEPAAAPAPRVFRYTNPITRDAALGMRDHFIIKVGDKWYATGTSNPVWTGPNPDVRLLVSSDLLNWEHHSWLIDASTLSPDCPYNGRSGRPRSISSKANTG